MRRAGGRCRGFLGGSDIRCDWGRTLGQGIRLTEKNYFAAVQYRTGVVAALAVFVLLMWIVTAAALASGTVPGLVAGLSGGLLVLPARRRAIDGADAAARRRPVA